eukprot:GHUV01037718.1.p2 GENE.GHUV01037718.1~~GHUV01037718.1.p2  ORF type:complete len:112 (-),score=3.77 GHUV01037718.1:607-942(-)
MPWRAEAMCQCTSHGTNVSGSRQCGVHAQSWGILTPITVPHCVDSPHCDSGKLHLPSNSINTTFVRLLCSGVATDVHFRSICHVHSCWFLLLSRPCLYCISCDIKKYLSMS